MGGSSPTVRLQSPLDKSWGQRHFAPSGNDNDFRTFVTTPSSIPGPIAGAGLPVHGDSPLKFPRIRNWWPLDGAYRMSGGKGRKFELDSGLTGLPRFLPKCNYWTKARLWRSFRKTQKAKGSQSSTLASTVAREKSFEVGSRPMRSRCQVADCWNFNREKDIDLNLRTLEPKTR